MADPKGLYVAHDDGYWWSGSHKGPAWTGDPAVTKRMGVYMGSNNADLDTYTSGWSTQPNVSSFYMNWNSSVSSMPRMSSYASQGRAIMMTLLTAKTGGSGYVTWADIAAGTYDSYLASWFTDLDALGVKSWFALDNEPENRWSNGVGGGIASGQTAAQYVSAMEHIHDLIHSTVSSGRVNSLLWLAAYQSVSTLTPWMPDPDKLDYVGWDKYCNNGHGTSPTALSLWQPICTNLLDANGYTTDAVKRVCPETGIVVDGDYDAAEQIGWWQSIPDAMDTLDIESVIYFRSNSGGTNYVTTDTSVDTAFASVLAGVVG